MSKVQSYEQLESMFSAFEHKCHERDGLSHLRTAFSILRNMDVAEINDDVQNLVLDYCLFAIGKASRVLGSQANDQRHWHKILKEFINCENLPGPKMASCAIKVRELLEKFDTQEDIAALRWLHEGEGLDTEHLLSMFGGLDKRQRDDAISYYRDRRLVDIDALAKLKGISFGMAQEALLQYPPRDHDKILKNDKCQEISRQMRREIRRRILSHH